MRLPPPHPPPTTTMGCGISKINLMEEGVACGLKRKMADSSPSKKDLLANPDHPLLNEDIAQHDDYDDDDDIKEPPLKQPVRENEFAQREKSPLKKKKKKKKERKYKSDDDGTDEDNSGRKISDVGGNWVGSPSFREYCVHSHSDDIHNGERRGVEKSTQGSNVVVCTDEVCVLGVAKSLEKKGSRGGKFIKGFPMQRPKQFWCSYYSRNNNNHVNIPSTPSEKPSEKPHLIKPAWSEYSFF